MKAQDHRLLDLLQKGREVYGYLAIKAEFEAEGTRPDEFLRLFALAKQAGLQVALKIGGCEAVSDLRTSLNYGVNHIIAPMIESEYALLKFIQAKNTVYGLSDEGEKNCPGTKFLFNLETMTAFASLQNLADAAKDRLDGIVFGRVDYTLSTGKDRSQINGPEITKAILETANTCREKNLELVVGGAITPEVQPILSTIHAVRLDRFETRKIVFSGDVVQASNFQEALATAMQFEKLWLEAKRDYYLTLASEDMARLSMLHSRCGD